MAEFIDIVVASSYGEITDIWIEDDRGEELGVARGRAAGIIEASSGPRGNQSLRIRIQRDTVEKL